MGLVFLCFVLFTRLGFALVVCCFSFAVCLFASVGYLLFVLVVSMRLVYVVWLLILFYFTCSCGIGLFA